ncbi:unnamed protein product [Clonostachys rosea]|uniref:Protein kinase domain-containing protein n=1 Tax=Bionectria ochroleuca TaxID=29856 RepID=A0ABY6UDR8_BIOOC|nr:unnamed protein product [Clonostachys rosea]
MAASRSPQEAANGTIRRFHLDKVQTIRDNGERLFHEHNPTTRYRIKEPKGATTAEEIRKIRLELANAQVWYQFDYAKQFIPRSRYAEIMTPERVLGIIYSLLNSQTPHQKQVLAQNICFGSGSLRPALKVFGAFFMIKLESDICEHLGKGLNDGCLPLKAKRGDVSYELHCECPNNSHTDFLNSANYLPSEREAFVQWTRRLTAPYISCQPDRHSHYVLDPGNCIPIKLSDATTRVVSPEQKISRVKSNSDEPGGTPADGGYGGFSEVHKVKLHACHYRLPDTGLKNSNGYYAIKRLTSHNRLNFEMELSSLLFSADQNGDKRHMIQVLATFEELNSDQSTFYLLFDCAEGDLEYFWRQNKSLVGVMSHCLSMSEQFVGLARTLEAIHNERLKLPLPEDVPDDPKYRNMYGRHGDIKPSNILYFQLSAEVERLVLADFGLGRLHTKVSRSKQNPKILGRTETYRSPEFDLPDGLVGPTADVYSLGCVFLEHITWFLLGPKFPDKFSEVRSMKDFYGFEADTFFMLIGPDDAKIAEIKPAVKQWIAELKKNEACSWFLVQMLELIELEMLQCDKDKRIRATPLVKRLQDLQKTCQHAETFYMKSWKDGKWPAIPE